MTTAGASFSSGTVLSTYIFELGECDRGLTLGARPHNMDYPPIRWP